jgi:hypothetical protein
MSPGTDGEATGGWLTGGADGDAAEPVQAAATAAMAMSATANVARGRERVVGVRSIGRFLWQVASPWAWVAGSSGG